MEPQQLVGLRLTSWPKITQQNLQFLTYYITAPGNTNLTFDMATLTPIYQFIGRFRKDSIMTYSYRFIVGSGRETATAMEGIMI